VSGPALLRTLGPIEWSSQRHYRMLAHYFTIRSNSDVIEEPHRLIARFEVPEDTREMRNPPTPNVPPVYSLVELGRRTRNRFRLFFGESTMIVGGDPNVATDHLLWHVHAEAIRFTGDFLLVHAGAVRTPSGAGMLLPAHAESGKSTLTLGLVRAGFGYLSDEAAAIDPVTRMLYPFPKAITLKRGSFDLFPEHEPPDGHPGKGWVKRHVVPEEVRPDALAEACPIGFVVAPRFEKGARTSLEPVSRATAVTDLWQHAFNAPLYGRRAPILLAAALERARCFRLVFGDLDEAVSAVCAEDLPGST
jgi:hypothetical protein